MGTTEKTPEAPAPARAVLGLLVAPGPGAEAVRGLQEDLRKSLQARFPDIDWSVQLRCESLAAGPAADDELVDAARRVMLANGWHLCLCLTDLPLHVHRRPVIAHGAPLHGVGLICLPALGVVAVRRRAQEAALRLIDALLGEAKDDGPASSSAARTARLEHRLQELVGAAPDRSGDGAVRMTARVASGHLRLLFGMVRANRPWRLAVRLSRACGAAAAAGVFALVTSDVWRLAEAMGAFRLAALGVVSVTVIVAALVVGAGLWERPSDPRLREQAILFNLATTATVTIGVAAFYLGCFALALPAAALLITPGALSHALGHAAGPGAYARLAWLACSLATLGGAVGARLETHEAVRHAAYTYRTSRATEQQAADTAGH